jgi:hypothetical protein
VDVFPDSPCHLQVAPPAQWTLQHTCAHPVLPQSCPGSAGCAPKHQFPVPARVQPGGGFLTAEAQAVGGAEAALPAAAELPAHAPQVCSLCSGRALGGAVSYRCSPLLHRIKL